MNKKFTGVKSLKLSAENDGLKYELVTGEIVNSTIQEFTYKGDIYKDLQDDSLFVREIVKEVEKVIDKHSKLMKEGSY